MISFASVKMDGKAKPVTHVNISVTPTPAVMEGPATTRETLSAASALLDGKEPLVTSLRTAAASPTPVLMEGRAWATEIPSRACVKRDGRAVPAHRIQTTAIRILVTTVGFVLMALTGFVVNVHLDSPDRTAESTSMNASLPLVRTVPLV